MLEFAQSMVKLWPVVLALLVALVWIIRLEGRVNLMDEKIEKNRGDMNNIGRKTSEKDDKIWDSLVAIKESLARIEGQFKTVDFRLQHLEREADKQRSV